MDCTQTCHQTLSNMTVVMTADSYSVMQGKTFNITIKVPGGPVGTPLGVILSIAIVGTVAWSGPYIGSLLTLILIFLPKKLMR